MTAEEDAPPPRFPLYVRVLAVAHVLSYMLSPVVFVICVGAGGALWTIHRAADAQSLLLIAVGLATPAAGALYRRWFESWGRANWPEGKPDRF